jgi:hypothetical protein
MSQLVPAKVVFVTMCHVLKRASHQDQMWVELSYPFGHYGCRDNHSLDYEGA